LYGNYLQPNIVSTVIGSRFSIIKISSKYLNFICITLDSTVSNLLNPKGISYYYNNSTAEGRLYVADYGNDAIKLVIISSTGVATLSTLTSPSLLLQRPLGVTISSSGETLYVTSSSNNLLLSISTTAASPVTLDAANVIAGAHPIDTGRDFFNIFKLHFNYAVWALHFKLQLHYFKS